MAVRHSTLMLSPQAEGEAEGGGRGRGATRRSSSSKGKLCVLCNANPTSGNNPYCKEDKKEYGGLKKDAQRQGKTEIFEKALNDTVLLRKLLQRRLLVGSRRHENVNVVSFYCKCQPMSALSLGMSFDDMPVHWQSRVT